MNAADISPAVPVTATPCTAAAVDLFGTDVTCVWPSSYRTAQAAMRLHGSKGVIFLANGEYISCNTLTDFQYGHGKSCSLRTLYLDGDLDPDGVFTSGPDAAAVYITSTSSQTRFYLFLGV